VAQTAPVSVAQGFVWTVRTQRRSQDRGFHQKKVFNFLGGYASKAQIGMGFSSLLQELMDALHRAKRRSAARQG
jgi:hypothetical protein